MMRYGIWRGGAVVWGRAMTVATGADRPTAGRTQYETMDMREFVGRLERCARHERRRM